MARDLLTGSVSGNDTDHDLLVKAAYALQELAGTGGAGGAVQYTPQTRTAAEQLQARTNIGAAPSVVPAFYAELAAITPVTADNNDRKFHNASFPQTLRYETVANSFSTATSRFTVPAGQGGWYRFRGMIGYGSGSITNNILWIIVNDPPNYQTGHYAMFYATSIFPLGYGERIVQLNEGDYVQLGYELAGTVTTTRANSPGQWGSCWWAGEKL